MRIGIIVHSKTGNTLGVANRLKDTLTTSGIAADLDILVASKDEEPDPAKVVLDRLPETKGYDALVLGAPVRGFSLSPIMAAYLDQAELADGASVYCYVTHFFPFHWMGGNQALGQFRKRCEAKGLRVEDSGVIDWSSGKRDRAIDALVSRFASHISIRGAQA